MPRARDERRRCDARRAPSPGGVRCELRRRGLAPDLARGDHAPFWEAGVPAIVLGDTAEYRNPHYHAPSDTIATLDLEFAARVARLAAAAVLLAADARAHSR